MENIPENPTAIDLVRAEYDILQKENQIQTSHDKIKKMLHEKEEQISEKIIERLVNAGSLRSNLTVNTTIMFSNAVVNIKNWNYEVEYRHDDLFISEREDILDDIKLSEMNQVYKIIKEVITEEGLK